MRIRATCERCGRDFLFFQLYAAGPEVSDRCPSCSAHLGIMGVGRQAARAEQALASLVQALEEMGEQRRFTIQAGSVLGPIQEALGSGSEDDRTEHREQPRPGRPWRRLRRAA